MERRQPLRRTPMKRGTSQLRRGKPLEGTGTPLRRTPLNRVSPQRQSTAPARKPAKPKAEITPAVKALVMLRCQGMCEGCGDPLGNQYPTHYHHRQTRELGDHGPANVVALHSVCHVIAPDAVHQNPAAARRRGLIVSRHADPAGEPLTLPDGRRVRLDPANPYYLDLNAAA